MTHTQYRAAIARLGLTQERAAVFLGVGLKTSQRWANEKSRIPEAVAKLLRLMIRLGIKPDEV